MDEKPLRFNKKKEEINHHPLLSLPCGERMENRKLYMEFYTLVLQNLNFMTIVNDRAAASSSRNLLEEDELRWENSKEKIASAGYSYYDDLAFAEALKKAVCGYGAESSGDAPGATFLTYFNTIYAREVREESSRLSKTVVNQPGKRARELLRGMLVILEKKYGADYDLDSLPETVIRNLAAALDQKPEKIKELLGFYREFRCPESLTPPAGDDGEEMESDLADRAAEKPFAAVQYSELMLRILEDVCDVDDKEYSRLFLTNALLSGVKDENAADCGELLMKNESFYLTRVFVHGYLRFVMLLPEQITIRAIMIAPLIRELLDLTIAEYKGVGPSAVSNRKKRYLARLRLIDRKYCLQIMA